MGKPIVILGIFVADTTYRAARMPKLGETILGRSFALGPGGKGSNQSVAAAMAGGRTHLITRLGQGRGRRSSGSDRRRGKLYRGSVHLS
jgi:ribokinase